MYVYTYIYIAAYVCMKKPNVARLLHFCQSKPAAAMVLAGVPCGAESGLLRIHLDVGPGAIGATLKGCLLTRDRQHKGVTLADVHIPYAWHGGIRRMNLQPATSDNSSDPL